MSDQLYYNLVDFCQYLLNGLSQGSIYALIALGYTMVYGIIKLINFAHGEFFMLGAFMGLFWIEHCHIPFFPALLLAMVGTGLFAMLVERFIYRPLRKADKISALITALGTSLFIQYFLQNTVGADPHAFPSVIEDSTYTFFEISVTRVQLLIFAITMVLMIFLWWLVKFTKLGKAMRATSHNRDAAQLMGIDTNRIISLTFFIGASWAAAAGVLVGMYYNTVEPMMGMIPGMKSFVAAVLGGIGSIPGAVLGGFILGIVENLVVGLWESTYRDAVAFIILILILLVKPRGLLGKNLREKV